MDDIIGGFNTIFDIVDHLSETIDVSLFEGAGVVLLGSILVLVIAYTGIRGVLQQDPVTEIVSNLVVILFVWGMISWVITSGDLINGMMDGFTYIGDKVYTISGNEGGSDVRGALKGLIDTMLKLNFPGGVPGAELIDTGDAYELRENEAAQALSDPATYIAPILTFVFRFVMAVLVLIMTIAYLGVYVITQVAFLIGQLLGPLLAPFFLIQPLSFLATGWFRFMVITGMQKVAGIFMLAITSGTIEEVSGWARESDPSLGAQFALFSGLFLIVGIMAYLMFQAMAMGAGIVSGMPLIGSMLPNKMTPQGMVSASSTSLGKAGAAAKSAGKGATQSAYNRAKNSMNNLRRGRGK